MKSKVFPTLMLSLLFLSIIAFGTRGELAHASATIGPSLSVDDSINRVNATVGVKSGSQVTAKGTITNIGGTTLNHLLTGVYFIEGVGTCQPSDFSFEYSPDSVTWYPIDTSEIKVAGPRAAPMHVELVIGQVGGETLVPGASLTMYLRMTFNNDLTPISWTSNILQSIIVWVFEDTDLDRHWDGAELLYSQPPTYAGYIDWDNPIRIDLKIVHTAEIDGMGRFYYSIQQAIDAANLGDTIWVYDGTYNEGVTINKPLNVVGSGVDKATIDGSGLVLPSAGLVTVNANSGNVNFQGFTVKNAPAVGGVRIGILTQSNLAGPTYTVSYTKILGTNDPDEQEDYGFYAQSGKENIVFTHNSIAQTGANNMVLELHTGTTEVSYSCFDAGVYGSDSIFFMTYNGINVTTLQNVSYNTFDMGTGVGPFDYAHRATGISFNTPGGAPYPPWNTLTQAKFTSMYIAGNTFNDLKSHRRGIGFWNAGSGHNLESPIITGNTINGIPGATGSFGIDFYGLTDNTVITHNKITGTDTAIFLRNSDAPGTQIHYNCIAGNNVGVNWTIGSGTVNATLNWWGNSTGPRHPTNPSGIGDKVTDNVNFNPWSPSTFDYSPKHYPLVGSPVTFDASAAFGPCSALKTITSYTWNFSDGIPLVTTTNPVTVHSFDDFGVFKVTLTTNYNDLTTYVCYVLVQVAQIPTASFSYSPAPPAALDATTFDASSSTPNGGTLIEYKWNFGDGNVTTTANPITTHVYASDGTYNVTLTVRDDEDLSNSTWKLVGVLKHDVAVVNVAPYRSWIYGGRTVNINVTVTNLGNFTEATAVTLYFNITANQTIGTQTVELAPAETRTLTFTWDTHGVPYCHNYTITAVATVRFDINTTNNSAEGYIKIRILGDINGDGTVDVRDVAAVANAFGAYPGHPRWNPDLDMKLDNKIDVADIAVIAKNFGIVCP